MVDTNVLGVSPIKYDFGRCDDERARWQPPPPDANVLSLFSESTVFSGNGHKKCDSSEGRATFVLARNLKIMIRVECMGCGEIRHGWWNGRWIPDIDFRDGGLFASCVPAEVRMKSRQFVLLPDQRDEFTKPVAELFSDYLARTNSPKCSSCGRTSVGMELDHPASLYLLNYIQGFITPIDPRLNYRLRKVLSRPVCPECNGDRIHRDLESLDRLIKGVASYWSIVEGTRVAELTTALAEIYPLLLRAESELRSRKKALRNSSTFSGS